MVSLMNNEVERAWKKELAAKLKVPFVNLPEKTEENHAIPQ
jgi:hypothetical protein